MSEELNEYPVEQLDEITPLPLPPIAEIDQHIDDVSDEPEKDCRWLYGTPADHVLEACKKLTELSKTVKTQIHNDNRIDTNTY